MHTCAHILKHVMHPYTHRNKVKKRRNREVHQRPELSSRHLSSGMLTKHQKIGFPASLKHKTHRDGFMSKAGTMDSISGHLNLEGIKFHGDPPLDTELQAAMAPERKISFFQDEPP